MLRSPAEGELGTQSQKLLSFVMKICLPVETCINSCMLQTLRQMQAKLQICLHEGLGDGVIISLRLPQGLGSWMGPFPEGITMR